MIRGEKDTRTLLLIPFELRPQEITTRLKSRYSRKSRHSTFPKNVMELQRLCANPEASIGVYPKNQHRPALSADVLKLANSAGFIAGNA